MRKLEMRDLSPQSHALEIDIASPDSPNYDINKPFKQKPAILKNACFYSSVPLGV